MFNIVYRKEAKEKGFKYYFTNRECIRGHINKRNTKSGECYGCQLENWKEQNKIRDPEYKKQKDKIWRQRNIEKCKEIDLNKRKANPELYKKLNKEWRENNKGKVKEYKRHYKIALRTQIPPWLNKTHRELINVFYTQATELTKQTGIQYHVDHVIPLQGKNVCGLHVPWNLKVIPGIENQRKSNHVN